VLSTQCVDVYSSVCVSAVAELPVDCMMTHLGIMMQRWIPCIVKTSSSGWCMDIVGCVGTQCIVCGKVCSVAS